MFKKILIANRGEIALRVIRACAEMGIRSVAIYSEPDRESLHVKMADESYCVGPAVPKLSYLNIPSIISVAEVAGIEAVHPGYGFLSENSKFAEICRANQIRFIGPPPEVMEKVGNKAAARELARRARVPVIPGSAGVVATVADVQAIAGKLGYPVLIKASSGGGGKGMRVVTNPEEAANAFRMAQMEAQAAFGDADVYVEKMIENPRHIEIQILADSYGNVVYLGERECSVQRRHQKLLEESPSPLVDERLRREMGEAAVRLTKAAGYQNAGTVEFLVDKNRRFYFIEMNARLQVEHPVTEMVTGLDIVKEQIRITAGEHLSLRQKDVGISGHAIECRINAEDPDRDFMPSPGDIDLYLPPGGPWVRIDSHLYPGYKVLPHYDSLLAKLIVWGRDRNEAIARMQRCLNEFVLTGVSTTIPFHQKLLAIEAFRNGDLTTGFIEQHMTGSSHG